MPINVLTAALLLASSGFAIADDAYTVDKSGYMWGTLYKNTKAACGALPDDLEADYAKSIRLLSKASPDFFSTYQNGLKPSLKKAPQRSAQALEADCNEGQMGMRVQVRLARFWFMGDW